MCIRDSLTVVPLIHQMTGGVHLDHLPILAEQVQFPIHVADITEKTVIVSDILRDQVFHDRGQPVQRFFQGGRCV